MSRFNFKGPDQQRKVAELSGGERNRVHLAKLLRRGGNLLLLDEPTNDLDVDTLRALEEALLNFGGCAVVFAMKRDLGAVRERLIRSYYAGQAGFDAARHLIEAAPSAGVLYQET